MAPSNAAAIAEVQQQRLIASRFKDTRSGVAQCCGSSVVRQFFLTGVPLLILIGLLAGINGKSRSDEEFKRRLLTASSGRAVASLTQSTLEAHFDVVNSFSAAVKNRVWQDPYSVDELYQALFPALEAKPSAHRVLVAHDDQGTYASATLLRNGLLPGTPNEDFIETQAVVLPGDVFAEYNRVISNYGPHRFRRREVARSPYSGAAASPWIARAKTLVPNGTEWATWLDNRAAGGPAPVAFPALAVAAPIGSRIAEDDGVVLALFALRPEFVSEVFSDLPANVTEGLLVHNDTVILATTGGNVGQSIDQLVEASVAAELAGAWSTNPLVLPVTDGFFIGIRVSAHLSDLDGRSYTGFFTNDSTTALATAQALTAQISRAMEECEGLAMSLRHLTSTNTLFDLTAFPQAEGTIGTLFHAVQHSIGSVTLTTRTANRVLHFTADPNSTDAQDTLMEAWLPPSGQVESRRYPLADGLVSSAVREEWETIDATDGILSKATDALSLVQQMEPLAFSSPVLYGPKEEAPVFRGLAALRCATWPAGSVDGADPAVTAGAAANATCFYYEFGYDALVAALFGMRLELAGLTVVAFENGDVIAAAGETIPANTTSFDGKKAWEVVPDWDEASYNLLRGSIFGFLVHVDERTFTMHRIQAAMASPRGKVVVITEIKDTAVVSTAANTVVYVLDGVIVLCVVLLAAHAVHFVLEARAMDRVAIIVEAAAELATDEMPKEAERRSSWNKDIESMHVSAVQLFLSMKRMRSILPQHVVERHMVEGIVTNATSAYDDIAPAAAGGGAESDPTATTREESVAGLFRMQEKEKVVLALVYPSVDYLNSPLGPQMYAEATATCVVEGGMLWITDGTPATYWYFDGDKLSAALSAAKAISVLCPDCAVVLCRAAATYGVVSAKATRAFTFVGPAADRSQCLVRTVSCLLPTTDPGAPSPRGSSPVIVDGTTLRLLDTTQLRDVAHRVIGSFPACATTAELPTRGEIGGAATLPLFGNQEADTVEVHELFIPRPGAGLPVLHPEELKTKAWCAVGDCVAALAKGRSPEAAALFMHVQQHAAEGEASVVFQSPWDRAMVAALGARLAP